MNHYKKVSITFICFIILFSYHKCYCFEPWQLVHSDPFREFYDIASNDSTIIAVGSAGGVLLGVNDTDWINVHVEGMPVINRIIWYKKEYIAVGAEGGIYRSPTGYTWQKQISGVNQFVTLTDIYGDTANGMLVAVGQYGVILTSTDGVTWTRQISNTTADFRQILFANYNWVAISSSDMILYSCDAKQWNLVDIDPSAESKIDHMCTNGTQFVGVGSKMYISTSCSTWTTKKRPFEFYDKKYYVDPRNPYGYQELVNISDMTNCFWDGKAWNFSMYTIGTFRTEDLINWTFLAENDIRNAKLERKKLLKLHLKFEKVSNITHVNYDIRLKKYYLTSDSMQIDFDPESGQSLNTAIWTGNQMVVAGNNGTILTSPDLINWTKRKSHLNVNFNSAFWSGKNVIIAGDSGTILISQNGMNWNKINSGTTEKLVKIFSDASNIFAVGGNSVLTSNDHGLTWQKTYFMVPNADLHFEPIIQDMIWNGKQYIGVIDKRRTIHINDTVSYQDEPTSICVSLNKTDWAIVDSSNNININNIYAFSKIFNTPFGIILTSNICIRTYEGLNWERMPGYLRSDFHNSFGEIASSNLQVVAESRGQNGTYSTFDLNNWILTPIPNFTCVPDMDNLRQIVFMGSYFVAVGDNAKIWISLAKDEIASSSIHNDFKCAPIQCLSISRKMLGNLNTITYWLSQNQNITLSLFSLNGKFISLLDSGKKNIGEHKINILHGKLSPGTYILRLNTEKQGCINKEISSY